ncbi:autotransporter domain-containing protein [Reyranella sp.]|uniref:autotransporter domain-containing protein n=1 Tax=Reyranella sp. TaxID=1929291 RepID=UPI003BAD1D15
MGGGAGGSGFTGTAGNEGEGDSNAAGGGGGGGAGGGAGGAGGSSGGDVGGTGGDGGANGNGSGTVSLDNAGTIAGAVGGNGTSGSGPSNANGGGGGGAGGYGVITTGTGASSNSAAVTAGNGGNGGDGQASGGNNGGNGGSGGDGGIGWQFTASGATLTNTGTITGGNGGAGGAGGFGAGNVGVGGAGIVGTGLAIVNSGTISGGNAGSGGSRANAITFAGGTNVLEVRSGSTINGNVQAASLADTLRLGGSADASLNVATIGTAAQYRGFGVYEKTGSSTWTLTGTTTATTSWTVSAGTLSVAENGSLGANASTLTLAGGTLRATANFANAHALTLNSGTTNTIDVDSGVTLFQSRAIGGTGGLTKTGDGSLWLNAINAYEGGTTIKGGKVAISADDGLGAANGSVTLDGGTLQFAEALILASTRTLTLGGAGGTIETGGFSASTISQSIGGTGGLTKIGGTTLLLSGNSTYAGGTTVSGGTLRIGADNALPTTGGLTVNGTGVLDLGGFRQTVGRFQSSGLLAGVRLENGAVLTAGDSSDTTVAAYLVGDATGAFVKQGSGTMTITNAGNTYGGGTTVTGGLINFTSLGNFGTGNITLNGGGLQWATGNTIDVSRRLDPLGPGGGTFDTNGNTVMLASAISGSGGLTKAGLGTLILTGANTYGGGTTVSGGTLQGTTATLQGNIANNAAVVFSQSGNGTYAGSLSGTGSLALQGGGTYTFTGTGSFSGPTTVTGSGLVVNGSIASTVTLDSASSIGGSGTIGGLVSNGGTLAPGNSIGTLTVNGNFVQTGGTYVVEANAQGQSDRVSVNGSATISGAAVQAVASGSYATSATYTILSATGGVSGTYSGVTSNYAFLTPSLSYTANSVLLTLALEGATPFSGFGGNTGNQRAVGAALDQTWASATGDFATVVGALANLTTSQAAPALNAVSGQPYADIGTTNVAGAALFMNTLGQQMANARSGTAPGARVALAQACEIEACDDTRRLSAWFSGLGGLGSIQGNGNASTLTYNVGGGAAGIDYRLDPRFLVGLGVGYAHGTQWVSGLMGQGWSDSVSVAAYGSFMQSAFYADALAGYAYIGNQMQRQIQIPGLQPRTASGSAGANQALAQVETGYRVGLWDRASVTPFARFQASSSTQNGFTESGANSLNLTVAQQTTSSVRSVLGAALDSTIGAFGFGLRLGWQHEYANVGRPITASFAGAPSASFTVYGATPTRDAAIVGFSATTAIAAATQLYLRYDGELGAGTDSHALTAGLRLSW